MHDGSRAAAGLRERLTSGTEDKLGKALADLFENPLITGTIGRAFDARERAAQAQELALSALNIPTAADIERLTRRLRSVSQRLEGIEDGVHRINRAFTEGSVERRLAAMEEQLKTLAAKLPGAPGTPGAPASAKAPGTGKSSTAASGVGTRKVPTARKAATPARKVATPTRKTAAPTKSKRSPTRTAPRAKKST
jgi:hypothetical protein